MKVSIKRAKHNKKYIVLGCEVDKETYKKYTSEKFPFMGNLVGLYGLFFIANDEEIKEKLPNYHNTAMKIINDIKHEIGAEDDENSKNPFITIPAQLLKRLYEESVQYNWLAKCIKAANNEGVPCIVSDVSEMGRYEGILTGDRILHYSILTDVATEAYKELQEYDIAGGN